MIKGIFQDVFFLPRRNSQNHLLTEFWIVKKNAMGIRPHLLTATQQEIETLEAETEKQPDKNNE